MGLATLAFSWLVQALILGTVSYAAFLLGSMQTSRGPSGESSRNVQTAAAEDGKQPNVVQAKADSAGDIQMLIMQIWPSTPFSSLPPFPPCTDLNLLVTCRPHHC